MCRLLYDSVATRMQRCLAWFSNWWSRQHTQPTVGNFCADLFLESLPSSLLGLCSFSIFWPSWPRLGAIWARFGKVWGSILRGFGLDFASFWRQFGHTTPLGKPALSIHSAGVWFWMGWWGYAKRKELFYHVITYYTIMCLYLLTIILIWLYSFPILLRWCLY